MERPVSLGTGRPLRAASVTAYVSASVIAAVIACVAFLTAAAAPANAAVHAAASPITTPTIATPAAAPTVPATSPPTTIRRTSRTAATKPAVRNGTARHRVTATGGKGVAVRATPAATGTLLGRKAEGASLTITCQVKGTMVRDTTQKRSSALWDKLSSGGYVANIYTTAYEATTTGYSAGLKACSPVKSSATTTKTTTIATTVAANGVVDNTAIAEATRTTQPGTVTAKTTVTSTN